MAKILQLLRNATLYETHEAAVSALQTKLGQETEHVGEPILARYLSGGVERILLGIVGANGAYEIFDNEANEGIIDALDAASVANENKVVTDVTQTNGQVTATASNITGVKIGGYSVGADNSGKVADTDTLGAALGKLQGQINGMDLPEVGGTDGDVITAVSEADGKVSATKASLSDVKLTGYTKDTTKTGAIAATDTLEDALSKLENKANAQAIASADESITVTNSASGTDIAVNVDAATIVKDATNKYIKSGLTIESITQGASSTYASQYKLVDANGTQIGATISVAKDQFLKEASYDPTTQKLTLTMYNATGGTTDIEVDFAEAVIEAEAGDGLFVGTGTGAGGNGKAEGSLNVGVQSEQVTVADGNSSKQVAVLTVEADKIVVNNIQNAIDYAVSTSVNALDASDSAVTHQFVTAVSETDGVITVTREQPAADDISATAITAASDTVAIAGTDVKTQIENIGKAIKTEETARINAIEALDDEDDAVTGKVVTAVVQTDGKVGASTKSYLEGVNLTNFTTNASTTGAIAATDTLGDALNKLQNKADGGLDSVSGSNAINVTAKASKSQTISLILDSTTATTNQVTTGNNALQITSDGLFLSTVWDCGTY